jgi:predicted DNA-binding antitoxin AbrB/MazE fold protein
MPLKKKVNFNGEEVDVVVIEAPVINEAELQKIRENSEGISEFAEKFGDRYEIRMKLDKTLWNYLTEIKLVLPILDKIKFEELYLNLMKILGYFLYICIFILLFQILIFIIDSLIDYDQKRNMEIVNSDGNVVKGTLGLKRDINLQTIEFLHSYEDIREVLFG